jgi:hypothetical protein
MTHGRQINQARLLFLGMVLALIPGCGGPGPRPITVAIPPQTRARTHFNPATAGTISGRVAWHGGVPRPAPFRIRFNQPPGSPPQPKLFYDNPNGPAVDPASQGLRDAVVYLRGVDPKYGKTWDLPGVTVEQRHQRFHVRQGKADSRVGFVRRGDAVTMVSRDAWFYSLHAGGAAFFTLAFPDPDRPARRRLEKRGMVELTSGAGHFWMRAYLFVDDHPYYARTDSQGRFTLERVPPGKYELVCWVPNWEVERRERDPETGQVSRIYFRPPVERVRAVLLKPGHKATVNFRLDAGDFGRE